jgi:uncharacterized phage protein gp47/JayE
VSYYPPRRVARLTDRNPGSVTRTLAEAFARELAVLHRQMDMIYRSAFLDLASGASLDHVAALLGLTRKDARFAGGEVLFSRSTPAPGDITIPSGTLLSTNRGENFETTDKRTLRRGQLSVTAPIRAQVEGTAGRVDAGAITNVNRPIFGVEVATNRAATFFATDKETDEEFRRRIRATLERAGRATPDAIRFGLIEQVPGVNETNVQVVERLDVPGIVDVKLGLGDAVTPELVQRVEEAIFRSRAAGVRVTHNLPTRAAAVGGPAPGAGPGGVVVTAGATGPRARGGSVPAAHVPADVLARAPEGVLPLRIDVQVRLGEPNLSAAQKEAAETAVRERVAAYVEALPMGADFVHSKLLGRVADLEQVSDATLRVGADLPGATPVAGNLATDGRKATLATLDVTLMDEAVLIDVRVTVEATPAHARSLTDADRRAASEAVERVVTQRLAAASGQVQQADLRAPVAAALAALEVQLAGRDALVLDAEYEDTGRLVSNAERVTLEVQHVPRLRRLTVDLRGPADA